LAQVIDSAKVECYHQDPVGTGMATVTRFGGRVSYVLRSYVHTYLMESNPPLGYQNSVQLEEE